MFKNRNYKLAFISLFAVIFLTVGFASLSNTLTLSDIAAVFRIQKEIRVTNFYVSSSSNSGSITYDEYNYNRLVTNIALPNQDSTVTFKVEVTNLGNFIGRIDEILNLPENLYFELADYAVGDDICDSNNNCRNGIVKEFFITIGYVEDGYDEDNNPNGTYNLNLEVVFSENYRITYIGNEFYALTRRESSLSIDYDPYTSILTLSGTTSIGVPLMNLTGQIFAENDEYEIYIEHLGGSYSSSGDVYLTTEIQRNDNTTMTVSNMVDTVLPDDGSITDAIIANVYSETEGSILASYLHPTSSVTFNNYMVKVYIYRPLMDTLENGENYTLPSEDPEKENFTFDGWYTEETGGTEITEEIEFTEEEDMTIYAQFADNDVVGAPTISYEDNYVTSGLKLLLDGRNNTGSGHNSSATTWNDLSGNSNNGTLINTTWNDNYLSFNGSNTGVMTKHISSSYYTLEAIVKINEIQSGEKDILVEYQAGGMGIDVTDGYPRIQGYINGSYVNYKSSTLLETNKIYSITGSYDGSSLKLYVNGVLDGSNSVSGTIGTPTSGTVFALGCNPSASQACEGTQYLNGNIYSARVYNRALTYDEIRHNYAVDALYIGNYSSINPSVNLTGANTNIGIKEYKYKIDSGNFTTYNSNNKPTITTNGEHTINAYAINLHTTVGPTTTETVLIDNENPTVNVELSGEKELVKINVSASDSLSGIRSYSYNIQTNITCDITNNYTETNDTLYEYTVSSVGTYYVCIRVMDNALNTVYVLREINSKYYVSNDTFETPQTGYYYVQVWGAEGGTANSSYKAGKGGYSAGYINLTSSNDLYFYIGGKGVKTSNAANQTAAGGANGGGPGFNNTSNTDRYAGSGGGATDARLVNGTWNDSTSLNSRIIVAGGGGGSWYYNTNYYGSGGAGGTLVGQSATGNNNGTTVTGEGGTQTETTFGQGAGSSGSVGPGGGGGYYGGKKTSRSSGGGSSFISGYSGSNAINSSRVHQNNTKHYSEKIFIDGTMTSGNNSGAGKARITYYGPNMPDRINNRLEHVRYVKDCTNGNTTNSYNQWVEIQVIDDTGTNVALNKTPVGTSPEISTDRGYVYITDGMIDNKIGTEIGHGRSTDTGLQCITIDLEQEYNYINEVAVWHYYVNGRTYSGNVTYVAGNDGVYRMIINHDEAESAKGKRINAWNVDIAANDEENPVCTITSSTNILKSKTQTVTVHCTDDYEISSYYWGTTAPTSTSTYTSITKTDDWTGNVTATSAGTWYFVAKDTSGKTSQEVTEIYNGYTIINRLSIVDATRGTYTTANYAQASTNTFIAKPSTLITIDDMVDIPTGSCSSGYKGASSGTASTTPATPEKNLIVALNSNITYTGWYNRNRITYYYRPNGGTVTTTTTNSDGTNTYTWSLDENNTIKKSTNGGTASYLVNYQEYGDNTLNLADWDNSNYLKITKSGYVATTGKEWTCLSGCKTSGQKFSDASITLTPTTICANLASENCSVYLGVNWVQLATVRINGALGEKISWTGVSSGSTTLDNTGKKTGIKLEPGSYTFTAGYAFTTDFSTKYSRNYTVSSSTTTINVYPDGAIYWFGNGSVANSSLASKCGGAKYSWTDSGDGGSGTFTSITSKTWVGNDKNSMWARMSSSGGLYTAEIRCNTTYKKGSYTRLRALMKSTGNNFNNGTTFLATNYSYTDGNDEVGFSGNKYLNLNISSVSSSYGMHLYGKVRTKGGGEGSVRIYAIWLA